MLFKVAHKDYRPAAVEEQTLCAWLEGHRQLRLVTQSLRDLFNFRAFLHGLFSFLGWLFRGRRRIAHTYSWHPVLEKPDVFRLF